MYMIAQCLGAICGVGLVKAFMKGYYNRLGGGANSVSHGYNTGTALGAEIIGTFVLVYTVFSATDPKRSARDSHVPVLAPLPIGFAVFVVHLATIPITGTGINPARSFGAAVIFNNDKVWDDHVSSSSKLLFFQVYIINFLELISIILMMHVVDFLGWTICGSIGSSSISSVHLKGCSY
ncbi:Hypothetical predicted protein [Olea europaea subsp. europaea]|uniref:Aquaporin n=1 Tax=Olea europaea subsp. europaea TaxID=158383 RepID=A0A8S0PYI7_OLEEU|nr:Hypothetical predicted protein [Olea europaea subsp. europaea]